MVQEMDGIGSGLTAVIQCQFHRIHLLSFCFQMLKQKLLGIGECGLI